MNTLIRNAHLISQDPHLGERWGTDIRIEGEVISEIGADLPTRGAEVLDATGMVALPGLIDSHRHVWQGAIGGAGAKVSLGGYFGVVLARLLDKYQPEDVYAGVLWGALQALNAGVTTVVDWSHITTTPEHTDENVRALTDSGIRAVFLHGPPVGQGLARWFAESAEPHPADVRRVRSRLLPDDHARVTMGMAVRGPEFSTREVTAHDLRLARDLGLRASMHSGLPGYLDKYATISALDELGLLHDTVHHAHGAQFSDTDLARIADTGGHVTACPSVDMAMAMGTFPVTGRARARGLRPTLGVDTTAGAGSDLFSEMRVALVAERGRANAAALDRGTPPDTVESDHHDTLAMVTTHAAASWGLGDRIGSLAVGKQADIILVDTRKPHLSPLNDAVTTLVLNAGPSDVDTVFVAGALLKRRGTLVGAAAATALDLLERSRARLLRLADLADVLGPAWAAPGQVRS